MNINKARLKKQMRMIRDSQLVTADYSTVSHYSSPFGVLAAGTVTGLLLVPKITSLTKDLQNRSVNSRFLSLNQSKGNLSSEKAKMSQFFLPSHDLYLLKEIKYPSRFYFPEQLDHPT